MPYGKILPEKGVTRIDDDKSSDHRWQVRVCYNGRRITKSFSDNVCGGRDEAYHEAVRWRDECERDLGKPHINRRIHLQPTASGKTQALGVSRVGDRFTVVW